MSDSDFIITKAKTYKKEGGSVRDSMQFDFLTEVNDLDDLQSVKIQSFGKLKDKNAKNKIVRDLFNQDQKTVRKAKKRGRRNKS